MRLSSVFGMGFLLVALSGSGALAQNSQPYIALATSPDGAMTCGQFAGMTAAARDVIVRRMIAMAPGSSLTMNNASQGISSTGEIIAEQDDNNLPPLDSGRLMSACQAVNTASTLRDAFAHSNLAPGSDVMSGN